MNNYLIIKNFGPVKYAKIELKPFLILIGGQGTGKSTIAKVLSVFQDISWYQYILSNNKDASLDKFYKFGLINYFSTETFFEFKNDDFFITFHDNVFNLSYKGKTSTEEINPVLNSMLADNLRKFAIISESDILEMLNNVEKNAQNDDGSNKKTIELSAAINNLIEQRYREFIVQSTLSNMGGMLYVPAERNLAAAFSDSLASILVAKVPLQEKLLNYISYYEKARNEYHTYNIPFLDITYSFDKNEEGIRIPGLKKLLPLKECSSGIQSLLPMLLVIDYCIDKKLFNGFVIEEPEQNLFPDNQLNTLRYIVSKNNVQGGSCILTTHSPYLLSAINISLLAGKIAKNDNYKEEVCNILPHEYHLCPENVAAYALGDEEEYCKNIMNADTGTIDQNYLDTTSSIIGQEFGKLYKLYVKSLKDSQ